ncbi:MAG: hypothetical protein H7837_05845 [Magnetococcus sp. MYC-9]
MLNEQQQRLLAAVQQGFPLTSRPFHEIGLRIGLSEEETLEGLRELQERGIIKRIGVVVHHRELGYRANAMVVWDLPDETVRMAEQQIRRFDFVSLCYLRRRSLPEWPYNFYCMIHGQRREETLQRAERITRDCGLAPFARQVLFSRHRFKQCGAHYFNSPSFTERAAHGPHRQTDH